MENYEEPKTISVYKAEEDGNLVTKLVAEGYVLSENETFVKPEDGIYLPVHFDRNTGTIVGVSKEERDKLYPSEPDAPSSEDNINAQLILQTAKDKADYETDKTSQEQFNANLLLKIAQNNGGTK